MKYPSQLKLARRAILAVSIAALLPLSVQQASATFSFLGVAAGDASDTGITVWSRGVDPVAPANTAVTLEVSTDAGFTTSSTVSATTDSTKDYTVKLDLSGLTPATQYYYRFNGPGAQSNVGKFKTAPLASTAAPVHFAFSGDNDGLIRPYALASVVPWQNLDFYINLGDVLYENASNVAGSFNDAASTLNFPNTTWKNSPSVTLSNASLSFDGIPNAGTTFATQAQLRADYAKKYRENFLPVNIGGQNCLKDFYAGQANYTTWDNHELGNRKYIDGGAPAGGSVGGATGADMATGRGVDARAYTGSNTGGSGNVSNVNDAADLLAPATVAGLGGFMNASTGFLTLEDVFLSYQPIANRGTVIAPSDARTHGTRQLYSAQQWGKNAILINADARSYRDIRLKTATGNADDTGLRADNSARTYLGATQLAWLKQTLLDAQNNGVPWKFVVVSDPIDQIGPVGGALSGLTAATMQPFSGNVAYGPVSADGGKAFVGGYRAERNALLKHIADNHITNVVFMSTDDHQNRINELYYSPSGRTGPGTPGFTQADYVRVPYCFSIVCGPLGATGPDLFLNHGYASIQGAANLIANAEIAAGVDPIGLNANYPGLHDVMRDKGNGFVANLVPETTIEPATFYSPDTFNFTLLDVSADGKTLSVSSLGMSSTGQNSATEYSVGPQVRTVFSFQLDAQPITRGGFVLDRRINKIVQQLTITNNTGAALNGPIDIVLAGLSGNTSLSNATGTTAITSPGSPYITVQAGSLAAGASASVMLQFARPVSGNITYTAQAVTGTVNP